MDITECKQTTPIATPIIIIIIILAGVGSLVSSVSAESALFDRRSQLSCGSRLVLEFEVLEVLGKGGFGDVIKVINTCTLHIQYMYYTCTVHVHVHVHVLYMYMYMYMYILAQIACILIENLFIKLKKK